MTKSTKDARGVKPRAKTLRALARGHSAELKKRGIRIDASGHARREGRFVGRGAVENALRNIKRAETRAKAKPARAPTPASAPSTFPSGQTTPLGFERGPAFTEEREKLRDILQREPTAAEIGRALAKRPPPPKLVPTFAQRLDRLKNAGRADEKKMRRLADEYGIDIHSIYEMFHGYAPVIGKAEAA